MEPERNGKSRNASEGSRRGGRGRNWKNYRKAKPKKEKLAAPVCSICQKGIDSITQAIGSGEEGEVAHFDCILRMLTEQETLTDEQKISYIGNGNFAVVEYSRKNFSGGFTIVRRIPFEEQKVRSRVKKMVSERKQTAVV